MRIVEDSRRSHGKCLGNWSWVRTKMRHLWTGLTSNGRWRLLLSSRDSEVYSHLLFSIILDKDLSDVPIEVCPIQVIHISSTCTFLNYLIRASHVSLFTLSQSLMPRLIAIDNTISTGTIQKCISPRAAFPRMEVKMCVNPRNR